MELRLLNATLGYIEKKKKFTRRATFLRMRLKSFPAKTQPQPNKTWLQPWSIAAFRKRDYTSRGGVAFYKNAAQITPWSCIFKKRSLKYRF